MANINSVGQAHTRTHTHTYYTKYVHVTQYVQCNEMYIAFLDGPNT
jgi:hypothetical protein